MWQKRTTKLSLPKYSPDMKTLFPEKHKVVIITVMVGMVIGVHPGEAVDISNPFCLLILCLFPYSFPEK